MSNTATPELKWQFKLGNTLIDFPNPFGSIQDNKPPFGTAFSSITLD
ncbi:TPA: hypothetical protein ACGFXZ_001318 [Vibrio cholerae]